MSKDQSKADETPAVDIPAKATPIEAGDPVEDIAVSQLGGTFAERAAARAKAEKAVSKSSAEDKAVKKATTKKAGK
jgi:hypothetical protein